ncbi:MAG: AAA family ATPase, partial [Paludibacteraceae bacterium]|nr:AAA family ATPase [Paludibacteraceae bacterium]
MGLYLNPNADAFMEDKGTRIYVDKSLLIRELNSVVSTKEDFVCLSRPRRFGKSMAGNMISAYYSKGCDTREVFSQMKLGQEPDFDKYLNKFNVIKLDLNELYQKSKTEDLGMDLISFMQKAVTDEFKEQYSDIEFESNS